MKKSIVNNIRFMSAVIMFLGIITMFFACGSGGGGGGGSSSGVSGSGTLFITDDLSVDFRQVIATIYKVEFVRSSDGTRIPVFDDALGISYDLSELSSVMARLPNASIPAGNYSGVYVTVGSELILVDKTGMRINPNPNFAQNAYTVCSAGQCTIEVAGTISVADNQRVVLDFDLKQFTYDPASNLVTAKVVLDADGSQHSRYNELKDDDYDLKGIVESINAGSFTLRVIKAEHFLPDTNIVTVTVNGSTVYTCDDDDHKTSCLVSSLGDLQAGMKLEVHGTWDGALFAAYKVEVDEDDDIGSTSCTLPDRSISAYTGLTVQPEIEGHISYSLNTPEYSITVSGMTILITKETRIKNETGSSEQRICADQIPLNAREIEVEYYNARDTSGSPVKVACKLEFES